MRWAQVVLELALLVIGILIALAVDGWMDDRRDARGGVAAEDREAVAVALHRLTTRRTLAIRDLKNQVFVDDMYMQHLLDSGFVAPRPGNNLVALDGPERGFDERVAMPAGTANDRLWQLPADAPEVMVLANKVYLRGQVSISAIAQT